MYFEVKSDRLLGANETLSRSIYYDLEAINIHVQPTIAMEFEF